MNFLNPINKLVFLVPAFAIILAGSHFCSISNFVSAHHPEKQIASLEASHIVSMNSQTCCMNENNGQLASLSQPLQNFTLNTEIIAVPLRDTLISTFNTNSRLFNRILITTRPDPGALVLRC